MVPADPRFYRSELVPTLTNHVIYFCSNRTGSHSCQPRTQMLFEVCLPRLSITSQSSCTFSAMGPLRLPETSGCCYVCPTDSYTSPLFAGDNELHYQLSYVIISSMWE